MKPDEGWGVPGSKRWHKNNLDICSNSNQILEYLYEVLGKKITTNILREKALEIILEIKGGK